MGSNSKLDAIIITDTGSDSLSGTNPLKLKLDGHIANIQVIKNYIQNNGNVILPIEGDNEFCWSSTPKLNGIFLYSFLTERDFYVELIQNFTTEKDRFKELLSLQPSAVLISTPFIFFKKTLRVLADEIRLMAPEIYIIAGGSFIHYSYLLSCRAGEKEYETQAAENNFLFLNTKEEPEIDLYIASPRGENTLCKALSLLKNGQTLDTLENSIRLSNGSYVFGPRKDEITDHPIPEINWETLPGSIFSNGTVPLQASNGCPYSCSFCNFTKDRRLTYIKPLDDLVHELRMVQRRGAKYIWFVDDNFRLGLNDLDSVCQRFIDEDIKVQWMCFIRASTLINTDLNLLKRAGCIEVQIGLESGDPHILKNMNKKADPEMYKKVVTELMQNGINVSCYFISGFPGETEESASRTRKFIRSIENPDAEGALSWSIYPFLLSPLSPIYEPEMRKKFKLKGYLNSWSHQTMDYKQAKQLIGKAFFELDNSGPIYRGDNLKLLMNMSPAKRKQFYKARHSLSKKSAYGPLDTNEILESFRNILT